MAVSPPCTYRHTSCDFQTDFVWKNGSSSKTQGRKWEDMELPGRENRGNCVDQREMIMRWYLSTPGSPKYVLPVARSTSISPVSPFTCHWSLTMNLEAVIACVEGCTCRPKSSELRDSLGGRERGSLVRHWEAWIEQVLEMHLEAVIERGWGCNWGPRSSELSDVLGGHDWPSLEMHLQAMIEQDWRSTQKLSIWREARWQLRFYSFVNLTLWESRELSTTPSAKGWETGRVRKTHWERDTVNLRMMLYSMYAVLSVKSGSWHGQIGRDDLTSCS